MIDYSSITLLAAYPNRWGKGKVHLDSGYSATFVPECRRNSMAWIHAERVMGTLNDITCLNCRRLAGR